MLSAAPKAGQTIFLISGFIDSHATFPCGASGSAWPSCIARRLSVNGIQDDDGDLALGIALVIGVGRPELQRLFPQLRTLLARGGSRPRLHFRGSDLQLDLRFCNEVLIPAGVLRRPAFG